ncbi:two-component system sensor histidine kinase NtrB [Halorientalis halophila]|uniref:two-component system sensor histidine kinase NtrB n=1 Tax=Halorientalis halophila TaxID=3108499 RepID=UPI003008F609
MTPEDTSPAILVVDTVDAALAVRRHLPDEAAVEQVAAASAVRDAVADGPTFDCVVVTGTDPDGEWRRVPDAVAVLQPTVPVVLATPSGGERLAAAAVEADVVAYAPLDSESGSAPDLAAAVDDAIRAGRSPAGGRPTVDDYRTLVENAGDPMYVLDAAGRLVLCNEAMAARVGEDVAEIVGSDVGRFTTPESVAAADEALAGLLSNGASHATVEIELLTAADDSVPCEVSLAPVRDADGRFAGSVGVVRDIGDRKRREEALERQNERLERFAGVVSHDLRNPMEVARGRLELARETGADHHFDRVAGALDRMETIVDDLLALASQGIAVRETEPVSLDRIAREAWALVDTGDAVLTVTTDHRVSADPSRLQQLFENLFRNSVEHGSPTDGSEFVASETPVSVRVGLVYRGEGVPDGFYVADDGPGIPADRRESVFEYGTSGTDEGTGLGLAIVKDVVDAHGWRIRVADGQWPGERTRVDEPTRRSDGSGAPAGADDPTGTGARFEITGVSVCD